MDVFPKYRLRYSGSFFGLKENRWRTSLNLNHEYMQKKLNYP
jgi:hypothetical protein